MEAEGVQQRGKSDVVNARRLVCENAIASLSRTLTQVSSTSGLCKLQIYKQTCKAFNICRESMDML